MDIREALYTTRAMRRVKPDPIPEDVIARILDAAIRAPSGGNAQNWRFLVVDDAAVKGRLGEVYRGCMEVLWSTIYKDKIAAAEATSDDPESIQWMKVKRSADWLAENFETVPLFFFGFAQGDPTGGSIFPAIWNAMLAARAEGVGASLTSAFMLKLDEALAILEVPPDEGWIFGACVSMGYPTGRWGVAPRRSATEVSYRNTWGSDVGIRIDGPLWKG
ncbi:MAG: nitroreductase family protein [Myxococcales bacterium]|nr:nitroreductase family protein [Myxococcales bacterium]